MRDIDVYNCPHCGAHMIDPAPGTPAKAAQDAAVLGRHLNVELV